MTATYSRQVRLATPRRVRVPDDPDRPCTEDPSVTRGQHRSLQGVAPTGKRIEVRGVQIGRFENGKIVERWGSTDGAGIMQQLGAAPQPG